MKLLITFLLSYSSSCSSQKLDTCNKSVHLSKDVQRLPKEICIPRGYWVWKIIDSIDLTNDRMDEVALTIEKEQMIDGDTSFLFVYKKDKNGIYQLFKKYDNLYPIYFKSYDHTYQSSNVELNNLKDSYGASASFSEVLFNKNTIKLKFHTSARSGLLLHFLYNSEINDWVLVKNEEWFGDRGVIQKMTDEYPIPERISLSKFNMLDYLD